MKICQNCATVNDDTALACQSCRMKGRFKIQEGTPNLHENGNEQMPHEAHCPNCNQPTMPNDVKCPHCRMILPIRLSAADLVSNQNPNGANKFWSLGKKVNHSFIN